MTRSISPENPTAARVAVGGPPRAPAPRAARDLGPGWKVSPSIDDRPRRRRVDLAAIDGPGRITHIWLTTHPDHWRPLLLRAYWDGADEPAVEVPVGDFFGQGWGRFAQLELVDGRGQPARRVQLLLADAVPQGGARLTLENLSDDPRPRSTSRSPTRSASDERQSGYLHAQWRRSPTRWPAGACTRCSTASTRHAATTSGSYLAWGVNSRGWWGEGEIKFYLDGDAEFPTICGTGTEDYFGGAWNFDVPGQGYTAYSHAVPRACTR